MNASVTSHTTLYACDCYYSHYFDLTTAREGLCLVASVRNDVCNFVSSYVCQQHYEKTVIAIVMKLSEQRWHQVTAPCDGLGARFAVNHSLFSQFLACDVRRSAHFAVLTPVGRHCRLAAASAAATASKAANISCTTMIVTAVRLAE